MKDKEIVDRLVRMIMSNLSAEDDRYAVQLFVERVAIPDRVKRYRPSELKSYLRDALKRGTDHWDICSPADTEVSSFADDEDAVIYAGGARGKKILSE